MHEVSLMKNLLAVVEKAAEREGSDHVDVIHLRLGEMSGVNIDSLTFAFEVLSEGTVAEKGRLEFERIPLVIRCNDCNYDSQPETLVFRCPKCESTKMELISGREMEIDYILVDEGDPENESDSPVLRE